MVGRVEIPAEPELGQGGDVGDHGHVHRRHRDEQRDPVEPADEPAEPPADRVLAVLVERARHRVVAGELAEHQRDQEHPGDRDPGQPDVGRPAGAQAEHEQGEDADHRRQVGERHREIREQPEYAVELRAVPEVRQPGVVIVQGLGRLGPMPQGRPEAVRIARFVEPLIELRGLDRRLDHQAVEMLHLEPARRARHVPLPLLLRPSAKSVYRKRR